MKPHNPFKSPDEPVKNIPSQRFITFLLCTAFISWTLPAVPLLLGVLIVIVEVIYLTMLSVIEGRLWDDFGGHMPWISDYTNFWSSQTYVDMNYVGPALLIIAILCFVEAIRLMLNVPEED